METATLFPGPYKPVYIYICSQIYVSIICNYASLKYIMYMCIYQCFQFVDQRSSWINGYGCCYYAIYRNEQMH